MTIYKEITERAEALQPKMTDIRRNLHAYPETGWFEVRTSSLIAERLQSLGYRVLCGQEVCDGASRMGLPSQAALAAHYEDACRHGAVQPYAEAAKDGFTGVIGILDCGEGPVIGMRFDIDALPVTEDEQPAHFPAREGFASACEGSMHACGHDGHAAMGLGVAEVLASMKDRLKGRIKLIFQPAEEGVRGACAVVSRGHLEDVQLILGNHIWNRETEESGTQVGITAGATLATSKLDIIFKGKACHAGSPELGDNAMLAAATAILNMQAIPRSGEGGTRINVGTIHGGSGRNVICDRVMLEVEVRGETTELNRYMEQYCRRIAEQSADMHRCTCEIRLVGACGSLQNTPDMIRRFEEVCADRMKMKVQTPTASISVSEDYACMAEAVKAHGGESLFFYTLSDSYGPRHGRDFDFDEACLCQGVKAFCAMACDYMGLK